MPKRKCETIRPSSTKAMRAKCFICCGDMIDGRIDCKITACSLYYWQPYRELEPDLSWMENGSHLSQNRKALHALFTRKRTGTDD